MNEGRDETPPPLDDAASLRLLLRVNGLQAWRKLLSIKDKSKLLTLVITGFLGGYALVTYGLFFKGLEFLRKFPGIGDLLLEWHRGPSSSSSPRC
jgi:hypothetical protein